MTQTTCLVGEQRERGPAPGMNGNIFGVGGGDMQALIIVKYLQARHSLELLQNEQE